MSEQPAEVPPLACKHEYVRIFQRRLKGLERRLVSTKAYLPIGFKATDFGHLSEGSYCFCSKCRARLFPRRTQAEKLQAKLAKAQAAQTAGLESVADALLEEDIGAEVEETTSFADIHVEELEVEAVDVQDIEAEGVKISEEDGEECLLDDEEG